MTVEEMFQKAVRLSISKFCLTMMILENNHQQKSNTVFQKNIKDQCPIL